ncbi:AhpD-like protein [Rhexocercosporidium sp. MPI-PUGE-AT-0058]|nr:AhpD-like protein [Rhexocercosporidium sp. MPI-PUGE-AT-0058]
MSSIFVKNSGPPSPPLETATVQVHALSAGHFSLPEYQFVHPASKTAHNTVPSLAFLIQHEDISTGKKTRIVFDLGLRRDINRYSEPIRKHTESRQPMSTDPDVVKSLAAGSIAPDDIDYVILSHVHWDHIGEPRDFPRSHFIVGFGAKALLQGKSASLRGGHSFFEADLLPESRTTELVSPSSSKEVLGRCSKIGTPNFLQGWTSHAMFPNVIDVFRDGSLYIVDAPGHLPGHINLYAKTGLNKCVYLGGDACHDRRIIRMEKDIGTWPDSEGHICCIHADREEAERTIDRIRLIEKQGVEVIFAHDVEWEQDPRNKKRFWGFQTRAMSERRQRWSKSQPQHNLTGNHENTSIGESSCNSRKPEVSVLPDPNSIMFTLFLNTSPLPRSPTLPQTAGSTTQLKAEFQSSLGDLAFTTGWQDILNLSPEIFSASAHLRGVPRKKQHLPPKIQSLIALSVSSSSTHLYLPGIHTHMRAALEAGASIAEVTEVLELTSTLGIHACNIGVPILVEVMKEEGIYESHKTTIEAPKDQKRIDLREEFTKKRGYWHEFWEDFLRLDPEFFEAYLDFSTVPWVKDMKGDGSGGGVLEPKIKELVYCAFDVAATHLYQPGLKLHMKNAIGYGATPEEIMEVLEIATLLSLHTLEVAAPILAQLKAGT